MGSKYICNIRAITMQGIQGLVVNIEASLLKGLNKFTIVGLADRAIIEAKERIVSAIVSRGMLFPYGQLVINLSPAFVEKAGSGFDLAICLAILSLSANRICEYFQRLNLRQTAVIGELGLDGEVKDVKGIGAMVLEARELGFKNVILPARAYPVTRLISGINQIPITNVADFLDYSEQKREDYRLRFSGPTKSHKPQDKLLDELEVLFSREAELRTLVLSAAGGHNLLLDGPPGSGKSTLLSFLRLLLPQLEENEALDVFRMHNLICNLSLEESYTPPLRDPHHTISDVALIGGGTYPQPGEISLANKGILLLDELPEFSNHVLESLRQPLTSGRINVSRANYKVQFPADFLLATSRNPCPCGWHGDERHLCGCETYQINRYQAKISGPIMDRIDIKFRVNNIPLTQVASQDGQKYKQKLAEVRTRIQAARAIQIKRQGFLNAKIDGVRFLGSIQATASAKDLLGKILEDENLTIRSRFKIIKLAQTITDFNDEKLITEVNLLEALTLNNNM